MERSFKMPAHRAVDWLYGGWLALSTALLLMFRERVTEWPSLLRWQFGALLVIPLLARMRSRGRGWRFAHDWYPLALFILCFEVVARMSLILVPTWQDAHILRLEHAIFGAHPTAWMQQFATPALTELLQVGYFSFYVFFLLAGGLLYAKPERHRFHELMLATVIMYVLSYAIYLLFPTESPARTLAHLHQPHVPGGPVDWFIRTLQAGAGVHGNAFPSGHIASGFVSTWFVWRYLPRLRWWFAAMLLLMSVGAVYDRYHYVSDVVGGFAVGAAGVALERAWRRGWLDAGE